MGALTSHQQESRGPSRMMTGMCFDNRYARLHGAFYQHSGSHYGSWVREGVLSPVYRVKAMVTLGIK